LHCSGPNNGSGSTLAEAKQLQDRRFNVHMMVAVAQTRGQETTQPPIRANCYANARVAPSDVLAGMLQKLPSVILLDRSRVGTGKISKLPELLLTLLHQGSTVLRTTTVVMGDQNTPIHNRYGTRQHAHAGSQWLLTLRVRCML
jgi:hypothetical protein